MRSKVVRTLALALLLGGVSIVLGQQQNPGAPPKAAPPAPKQKKVIRVEEEEETPKQAKQKATPKKSTLEEMLAEALKNNPDIRVAAAKLAEADAELNRTRLQVTQKVVMLYYAIETQKKTVQHLESKSNRFLQLSRSGAVGPEAVAEITQSLALAKAKLEELEAQLPALLGKAQSSAATDTVRSAAVTALEALGPKLHYRLALNEQNYDIELLVPEGKLAAVQPKPNIPQAEKIRKALQTPVKVNYESMAFAAIVQDLSKKVEGLSFRNLFERGIARTMNLRFEEALPVSAILQALADETGCAFFVREYGILAIRRESAPPGAMTVEQFLLQKPSKDPAVPAGPGHGKNPPTANVEGRVKAVDASGLLTISIGSDAGLAKGHTLELFRLAADKPSESKYLGTIRILEVEAHQSVAQPVGRLAAPPQLGDRVASRILGK